MFFKTKQQQGRLHIALTGSWTIKELAEIKKALDEVRVTTYSGVTLDAQALTVLDTAGAWVLKEFIEKLASLKIAAELLNLPAKQQVIYNLIANVKLEEEPEKPAGSMIINVVTRLGEGAVNAFNQTLLLLSFIGQIVVTLVQVLLKPKHIRLTSIIRHIDETGINAIPIVALIAFLTSVVLAYQGATQLKQFGAEIFTINLVAISILREMGVLLTAILVAGRSGSAFAAEIGVMQVNNTPISRSIEMATKIKW